MLKDLKRAIVLTVSYSDQFDYSLDLDQLHQRLIGISCDRKTLQMVTDKLTQTGLILFKRGQFFLKDKSKNIDIKKNRHQYSLNKRKEIDRFLQLTSLIPWIRAIFLTGSVTQNNATKNDDLDFMIVTQKNRMWLARLVLMIFTTLAGKRRSWQGEEENSWCLNLWLEEDRLKMGHKRRNIYTAFEVAQAELLFEVNSVGRKFYRQNLWIKNFLPNIKFKINAQMRDLSNFASFLAGADFVLSPAINLLNYLCFLFQSWYMKPHKTREEVDYSKAFFHPRDTKNLIKDRWIESLKSLK